VLGSAAGGGFPQWNCNCRNCAGLRDGSVRIRARTQSSIAAADNDAAAWALVNASPDILTQLRANPDLQRGEALRDTAIASDPHVAEAYLSVTLAHLGEVEQALAAADAANRAKSEFLANMSSL